MIKDRESKEQRANINKIKEKKNIDSFYSGSIMYDYIHSPQMFN